MQNSRSLAMLRLFLIVTTVIGAIGVVVAAEDNRPQFKITTKRDTDKVEIKVEKDKTVFSIRSPVGISQAVIERSNDKWPECVALRLHLRGLEKLQISNGKITLNAAVSSHADDKNRVRLWEDGKEDLPLNSTSPFWMEISRVGSDGKPVKGVAPNDGYFEMQLPKAFFEGNPKSITVSWIDFYRN